MEAVGVPDLGSRFEPKWIGTVCLYGGGVPNGLMVAMVVISAADGDGGDGCDHCLTCRFRLASHNSSNRNRTGKTDCVRHKTYVASWATQNLHT